MSIIKESQDHSMGKLAAPFALGAALIVALMLLTSPAMGDDRGGKATERVTLDSTQQIRSEKRIALVIGNGEYGGASLKNPVNDAEDMAEALRGLGFEVVLSKDATQKEMKLAIRDFGRKLNAQKGVGLFYFAGHGVQVDGENYLIPKDALIDFEEDVETEAVPLRAIVGKMKAAQARVNIVILDACRNNPFGQSVKLKNKGLAPIEPPRGTLVAYATSPGRTAGDGTGRNGVYTAELLKFVQSPGMEIQDIFKLTGEAVLATTRRNQDPRTFQTNLPDFYMVPTDRQVTLDEVQQRTLEEGLTALKEDRAGAALEAFETVLASAPNNETYIHKAQAMMALGRCSESEVALRRSLQAPNLEGANESLVKERATALLGEVPRKCRGWLVLACEPYDIEVQIDGTKADDTCSGKRIPLLPGSHEVIGSGWGKSSEVSVQIRPGESSTVALKLNVPGNLVAASAMVKQGQQELSEGRVEAARASFIQARDLAPEWDKPSRILESLVIEEKSRVVPIAKWGFAGTAVLGLGAGAFFLLQNEWVVDEANDPDFPVVEPKERSELQAESDQNRILGWLGVGIGGASALVSAFLFLVDSSEGEPRSEDVAVEFVPGGVLLQGRF